MSVRDSGRELFTRASFLIRLLTKSSHARSVPLPRA